MMNPTYNFSGKVALVTGAYLAVDGGFVAH